MECKHNECINEAEPGDLLCTGHGEELRTAGERYLTGAPPAGLIVDVLDGWAEAAQLRWLADCTSI
jgi:hypothetical protein